MTGPRHDGADLETRVRRTLATMWDELPHHSAPPATLVRRARRGAVGGALVVGLVVVLVGAGVVVGASRLDTGTPTLPAASMSEQAIMSSLEDRPVRTPAVGAGCPTSVGRTIRPVGAGFTGSTIASGESPAWFAGDFAQPFTLRRSNRTPAGWYDLKAIWVVSSDYHGPVLIRAAQLTGAGGIGFSIAVGDAPTLEELPLSTGNRPDGLWYSLPTSTFIRGPGCFAYQVDGSNFTETIVFEARLP